MLKMAMVTYNEAVDQEVMEALLACKIASYTKVEKVSGRGETSGAHEGTDVWPGQNNIIYAACDEAQASALLTRVRQLRKTLGKEGLKAFLLPLEEMT